MHRSELLAPAGSMDALRAAVNNGADAVYIGVGTLNARANAQNFTTEDLAPAISYCHLHSALIYLTLNTLIHDTELSEALSLAEMAYYAGIDAIIVQDIGLAGLIHKHLPECRLFASTQLHLHSESDIAWAFHNGFSRVVLPRELSLDEIISRTAYANQLGIEVETFIHGALCVCYSGLCLFSGLNGNGERSGNRGLCAQPCRTQFQLSSSKGDVGEPERLLSPKDQSALPFLKSLLEAGVHSFKIEGRMKDPAYVAAVVRTYREVIDQLLSDQYKPEDSQVIENHLLLAFNRGGNFTTQYLQGDKKSHFLSGDYSGRFGVLLGNVMGRNAKRGTLSLRVAGNTLPTKGDYLSLRKEDKEIASFPLGSIEKLGDIFLVTGLHPQIIDKIPDGALVYQMSELAYTKELLNNALYKTPVSMNLSASRNEENTSYRLTLTVTQGLWQGKTVAVTLDSATALDYPPLTPERVGSQLSKSKSEPFDVVDVTIEPDFDCKMPISQLNELRRKGFAALTEEILTQKPTPVPYKMEDSTLFSSGKESKAVHSQLNDVIHVRYYDVRRILPSILAVGADYYSFSVYDILKPAVQEAIALLAQEEQNAKFLMCLPGAYKDSLNPLISEGSQYMKSTYERRYCGVVSSHLDSFSPEEPLWLNEGANLYNHLSVKMVLAPHILAVSPSVELKKHELATLIDGLESGDFNNSYLSLHHYGRPEWMQSEFCPVGKHAAGCQKCLSYDRTFSISTVKDSHSKEAGFPIITHPGPCTSEILGRLQPGIPDEIVVQAHTKGLAVAHGVKFLDEPILTRRKMINEIRNNFFEK